jgi:hypothetical protein
MSPYTRSMYSVRRRSRQIDQPEHNLQVVHEVVPLARRCVRSVR